MPSFVCIKNRSQVSLGEWNISSKTNCKDDICSPPKIYDVEAKIVHEDYEPISKDQLHDIALIRLNETVTNTR